MRRRQTTTAELQLSTASEQNLAPSTNNLTCLQRNAQDTKRRYSYLLHSFIPQEILRATPTNMMET